MTADDTKTGPEGWKKSQYKGDDTEGHGKSQVTDDGGPEGWKKSQFKGTEGPDGVHAIPTDDEAV